MMESIEAVGDLNKMMGNRVRRLHKHVAILTTADPAELLRWLDRLTVLVQNACRYPELVPTAADLALDAYPHSERRGASPYWQPTFNLLRHALAGSGHPTQEVQVLNRLGQQHRLQSELEAAFNYHHEALNLAYHLEESQWLAQTNWHLAEDYRFKGDVGLAHTYALQAWQFWQETDAEPERWRGAVANTLGIIATQQGDYETAVTYFEQAHATHLQLNLPVEAGRNLLNIGRIAMFQKDGERALACYKTALELVGDNTADKVSILINLGSLYVNEEKHEQALQIFYEAEHLLTQTIHQPLRQAEVTHNIAYALFKLEQWEQSIAVARQAAVYWEVLAQPRQLSSLLSILARASAAHGEREEALASYDRALALVETLPDQQKWRQTLQEWRQALSDNL
ncbi:MAG: tetratricopeptide repeat protein [Chloroflexi bacterium]|nr:tetratricopeptide repeat protein [Chloroflexota bacterium]